MPRHVLVKWVGDPRIVLEDGFSVADMGYENRRVVVVPTFNGTAGTRRMIGRRQGLSRTYLWEIDEPDMTIRMLPEDWEILHRLHPHEFKDVTLLPEHERRKVTSDVFVVAEGAVAFRPVVLPLIVAR